MMKHEFEEMVNVEISQKDYHIVETVYMYHPCEFDKEQIAQLFSIGGLFIMKELFPRADKIAKLESKKIEISSEIEKLKRN